MDILGLNNLFEEMIKKYDMSESHCILFYSKEGTRARDYKIKDDYIKEYRERFSKLLADHDRVGTGQDRNSAGAGDIQT